MAVHEFPFAVPYLVEADVRQLGRLVRFQEALYPGWRLPSVEVLVRMRGLLLFDTVGPCRWHNNSFNLILSCLAEKSGLHRQGHTQIVFT